MNLKNYSLSVLLFCSTLYASAQCLIPPNTQPELPLSNLQAHFSFEDDFNNQVNNQEDVTAFETTFEEGLFGQAIYFDGKNAYLHFADQLRFQPNTSSTVSMWIKTKQTSRATLLDQRTGAHSVNHHNYGIYHNCCNTALHYNYPNYNTSDKYTSINNNQYSISTGQWTHLVFIKDVENSVMAIYQDGCIYATRNIMDTPFEVQGELLFGKLYDDRFFYEGYLDELAIYDRAFNFHEVEQLYHHYLPPSIDITCSDNTLFIEIQNMQRNTTYNFLLDNPIDIVNNGCYDDQYKQHQIILPENTPSTLPITLKDDLTTCSSLTLPILDISELCGFEEEPEEEIPIDTTKCIITVPTAFSPNNDNLNDHFSLYSNCPIDNIEWAVYNRWGEQVFYAESLDSNWDGFYRNQILPIGVYVWHCTYTPSNSNYTQAAKGLIHLLK